ncbi:hypothetical protein BS50DRAFT_461134, partial [Corynespora cassiicola Philippines]
FSLLGTFFVGLRLWTRLIIIRAPGWEDLMIAVSWLFATATVIVMWLQIRYGLGEHASEMTPDDGEKLLINFYISLSTYSASLGLTKLAILMQYQRVFKTHRFQIWCWAFIVFIFLFMMATIIGCIFVCWPIQKFWQPQLPGRCLSRVASWFSNAAINIVTDLMIILLPIPVIKSLKLANRQKWLLMGLFAFGSFVCIISAIRLHSLLVITYSTDPTYDNAPAACFSLIEINVALVAACLPTLRPLLSKCMSGLSPSTSRS